MKGKERKEVGCSDKLAVLIVPNLAWPVFSSLTRDYLKFGCSCRCCFSTSLQSIVEHFSSSFFSFALWFANSKHTQAPFAFCLPLRLLEKGCWFVCQSQCDYTFNYLLLFFWAIISSATAQLNLPTFPLLS